MSEMLIDELVIRLGLDTSSLQTEARQTTQLLDKLRLTAGQSTASTRQAGTQAASALSRMRGEAVSLLAVLSGGRGLNRLLADLSTNTGHAAPSRTFRPGLPLASTGAARTRKSPGAAAFLNAPFLTRGAARNSENASSTHARGAPNPSPQAALAHTVLAQVRASQNTAGAGAGAWRGGRGLSRASLPARHGVPHRAWNVSSVADSSAFPVPSYGRHFRHPRAATQGKASVLPVFPSGAATFHNRNAGKQAWFDPRPQTLASAPLLSAPSARAVNTGTTHRRSVARQATLSERSASVQNAAQTLSAVLAQSLAQTVHRLGRGISSQNVSDTPASRSGSFTSQSRMNGPVPRSVTRLRSPPVSHAMSRAVRSSVAQGLGRSAPAVHSALQESRTLASASRVAMKRRGPITSLSKNMSTGTVETRTLSRALAALHTHAGRAQAVRPYLPGSPLLRVAGTPAMAQRESAARPTTTNHIGPVTITVPSGNPQAIAQALQGLGGGDSHTLTSLATIGTV